MSTFRAPRRRRNSRAASPERAAEGDRLQKVLAAAGLGSRRDCEELITTGRVEIDRKKVTELGTRVQPDTQEIRVDGQKLPSPDRIYYMVNKPEGVVCTNYDPARRQRVIDLVPNDQRLFTVGRLDRMSEGLILVTNDGALANRLAHPRYEVEKTYLVQVAGQPTPEQIAQLEKGVYLAEGVVRADRVIVKRSHRQSTILEIVLKEGKNREIRRVLARFGHKVVTLKRIAVGPLRLADLPRGAYRPLSQHEIQTLYESAQQPQRRRPPRGGGFKTRPEIQEPVEAAPAEQFDWKPQRQGTVLGESGEGIPPKSDAGRPRVGRDERPRVGRDERPRPTGDGRRRPNRDERPRKGGAGNERPRFGAKAGSGKPADRTRRPGRDVPRKR